MKLRAEAGAVITTYVYVNDDNMDNTCYMNSILQALFCTDMFQSQILTFNMRNSKRRGCSEVKGTDLALVC